MDIYQKQHPVYVELWQTYTFSFAHRGKRAQQRIPQNERPSQSRKRGHSHSAIKKGGIRPPS